MDYFTDVLAMFLSLDRVRTLAVYERAHGMQQKYQNAPKMNESLTGSERHEGELLMTQFSFLGELSL